MNTSLTRRLNVMQAPASSQADYCRADTRNPGPGDHYLSDPWPTYTCKRPKGHEGEHAAELNWNCYLKSERSFTGVELSINTYGGHGWGQLRLKSRAEVDSMIDFLVQIREETFPTFNE